MVSLNEAVSKIVPSEANPEKKPRLRIPTFMQAVLLPFYKVPVEKKTGQRPDWN